VPSPAARPYVLLSCAASLDGCIDDTRAERLVLSDAADLDRVDAVRAGCDAILVGAGTLRRDDPRLLVRSEPRRAERVARGLPASPLRATLTASGDVDPAARFFTTGDTARVVYTTGAAAPGVRTRLATGGPGATDVVATGDPLDPARLLADLAGRGVERLLVEGGSAVLTLFLTAGLADELHLVIAPFFVGDPDAPRITGPGRFPHDRDHPAQLREARPVGGCVLLRYALSDRCPRP